MAPARRSVVFQCALVLALARACQSLPTSVTTLAGSGTSGLVNLIGTSAQFSYPYAVAVDASEKVYVVDTVKSVIRVIAPNGAVTTLAGKGTSSSLIDADGTNAGFNFPMGIAIDSYGRVIVADRDNSAIRRIMPNGTVTTLATGLNSPNGVAVDSGGYVW